MTVPIYPWAEWLDGRERTLIRGVHYQSVTHQFREDAKRAASRRGLRLRLKQQRGWVVLQAIRSGGHA